MEPSGIGPMEVPLTDESKAQVANELGYYSYANLIWHCRHMLGALGVIANCRHEIKQAVFECARYQTSPSKPVLIAIKNILKYLKGSIDQELILGPTGTDCFERHFHKNTFVCSTSRNAPKC